MPQNKVPPPLCKQSSYAPCPVNHWFYFYYRLVLPFLEFYIHDIIAYIILCLASFAQHNRAAIHLCCMCKEFICYSLLSTISCGWLYNCLFIHSPMRCFFLGVLWLAFYEYFSGRLLSCTKSVEDFVFLLFWVKVRGIAGTYISTCLFF